ncbi:MAG: hypothetical protein V2J24_02475 [Pseudomonadales bacterium]|jgi:hypothetical protein|nr:hypothetical protein [Pseudomonadales bacterium]
MLRLLFLSSLLLFAGDVRSVEESAAPGIRNGDTPADETTPAGVVLARNDDLAFVRRRGVELYERHQAALVALDAAREVGLADIAPAGWVTEREGDALRVRFVGDCAEGPCGVLDVRIDSAQLAAEALYPPVPLTAFESAAWRVKQLVYARQDATCDVPYNAVALPPEGAERNWTVYLVPQPAEADVVAISGHVRVTVDPSGAAVLAAEDFSVNCILVRRAPEQSQIAIDHGWASMPAEIHVLNSLLHQLVFFVGTAGGVFRVNGDVVERLADVEAGS